MNHNAAVGMKIKKLRTKKKYTLKQLSEETGLSIGFLSQLERGMSTIAIDSLAKVAAILDIELSSFFESSSKANERVVRRHSQQFDQINPQMLQYILSNNIQDFSFLPRIFEILPSKEWDTEEKINYNHEGEEFVYVLEGILTIDIDGLEHTLYPGDSVQIHSNLDHNWVNNTNKITKFLSIHYPNPFLKNDSNNLI